MSSSSKCGKKSRIGWFLFRKMGIHSQPTQEFCISKGEKKEKPNMPAVAKWHVEKWNLKTCLWDATELFVIYNTYCLTWCQGFKESSENLRWCFSVFLILFLLFLIADQEKMVFYHLNACLWWGSNKICCPNIWLFGVFTWKGNFYARYFLYPQYLLPCICVPLCWCCFTIKRYLADEHLYISPLTNCCFHLLLETELSLDLILWHFIRTVASRRK